MSIREELILKVLAKEDTVVDLAEEYGIARKTIYKWLKRYQKRGLTGLVDESRRPLSSPMKTSAELALQIVQLKKEHTRWGPKKIATVIAKRHPDETTPSIVTVRRVLKEVGLMKRSRRRESGGLAHAPTFFIPTDPNDLWTVDFKGWWRTKDGAKCEPLTIRDAASRFVLAVQLMTRTRAEDVRPVFEEVFAKYGLPKCIQSDNGPPFASSHGLGGLTRLSAWWVAIFADGVPVARSRTGGRAATSVLRGMSLRCCQDAGCGRLRRGTAAHRRSRTASTLRVRGCLATVASTSCSGERLPTRSQLEHRTARSCS